MKKVGDVKAKANLQPPFYIREIDSKYPKNYRPSVKKDKEDANWEHRDEASKDKNKARSHTPMLPRSVKKIDKEVSQLLGSTSPR